MARIPASQCAVQLVGPDKLILNESKEVFRPGPRQILARVETVGLCFSDLKLLKQFTNHVRKGEVVEGVNPDVLAEIPSYVPGESPTVPGHETVVRIVEVGPGVERHKPGERYLVQTDYRWVHTASSNAAFGYNFEGALQEYVLMDERVITAPNGESMLIPAGEEFSGSAIALAEPWACVEDAYVSLERTTIKTDGRMLVVNDVGISGAALVNLFVQYGEPKEIYPKLISMDKLSELIIPRVEPEEIGTLPEEGFDDVIYFGADPEVVEALFPKLAARGLLNIVLCGEVLGRDVTLPVGRTHYGGIRIVGSTGTDPAESMQHIPKTGEIRPGDRINVVGAGGPMGMMHVVRNICQGVDDVRVYAGDVDDHRLATLSKVAQPLAEKRGVTYRAYNAKTDEIDTAFDYIAIMAPVPALVATGVKQAASGGIINIFAGIPATVTGEIDLDTYIKRRLYFIGTSGSTLDDMKRMLEKVETGQLDTNVSVAAISGLAGAVEGIRAVENRLVAGKIVVYPACKGLGLVRLEELPRKLPEVAACLKDGLWTTAAEKKLLESYGQK
jgi:D-arabinose 1-dehydrogenase-like Zn-dependent alcohol dehydrogenase